MLSQFTDNVAVVRKKVLSGIQLSTELAKRSLARQCLDAVNNLVPKVTAVIKNLCGNGMPMCFFSSAI